MKPATREELIRSYDILVRGIREEALDDTERSYGGVIRAAKGKLVEQMAPHIIGLAWQNCGGQPARLSIDDVRKYDVPIRIEYVESLPDDIKEHVKTRIDRYKYRAGVDRHVFVDGKFVMGVECKAYAENAMLKRILFDYQLLKSIHPRLVCSLLQLESQLGGDYSRPLDKVTFGSFSTHTLMSFFPELDLNIHTLLEGERKVDRPIHQPEHHKELKMESLDAVVNRFAALLSPFV